MELDNNNVVTDWYVKVYAVLLSFGCMVLTGFAVHTHIGPKAVTGIEDRQPLSWMFGIIAIYFILTGIVVLITSRSSAGHLVRADRKWANGISCIKITMGLVLLFLSVF